MNPFDLKEHELTVTEVHRNLPPSALYEHAIHSGTRTKAKTERDQLGQ